MNLLSPFNLLRPASLAEAVQALSASDAKAIAGGTDLLPNLRRGLGEPGLLVDLSAIDGLSGVEKTEDGGLRIGAMTKLEEIAESRLAPSAVRQAALGVAGPTHRAQATLGGNLCQDTRCVFYNQSDWWREGNGFCLKYRGDKCHVVAKSDRCYATYHGDIAPALMVLGAVAEIVGPAGDRQAPLADIYQEQGACHLRLSPGEALSAVILPSLDGWVSAYEKARVRESIEFPLAGVAVALRKENGVIGDIRLAITGTNSAPLLVPAQELLGRVWDDAAAELLQKSARKASNVLKSTVVGAKYRRRALLGLTKRVVNGLWIS